MTRQELATKFGISTRTLNKWINDEGIKLKPGLLKPRDVATILEKLGFYLSNTNEKQKL